MPSPRPTAHVLLPAMAVLVLCAVAAAQVTPTPTTVEALIEAGRYAEAESDAVRALDRALPADADIATGRLIEALLRNGRGTEARTTRAGRATGALSPPPRRAAWRSRNKSSPPRRSAVPEW